MRKCIHITWGSLISVSVWWKDVIRAFLEANSTKLIDYSEGMNIRTVSKPKETTYSTFMYDTSDQI